MKAVASSHPSGWSSTRRRRGRGAKAMASERGRVRPALGLGLLLALAPTAVFAEQPVEDQPTSTTAIDRFRAPRGEGMPEIDTSCAGAEEFGGTEVERAGWCLYEVHRGGDERFASIRTLAERALREDPQSFRAHYLLGVVQHQGEGNLPKALFHLERAEQLFIQAHGEHPPLIGSPVRVFHRTLLELIYVHGEMDHHEEKIRYVDLANERLGLDYTPLKAWPLLKLKRFEEARLIAWDASTHQDPFFRAVGLTALCAVESEQRRRQEAYRACRAAAEPLLDSPTDGAIELSNAAAAASELFKFDEAERLYLEAARRPVDGAVNPWGRLVRLYLRQGRFAEALSAWREMREYRKQRPKYLDQQDQSDADLIGAAVLIISGRSRDALPITERTVNRPDRQGTSSAEAEQNESGAAIMDRVVKLDVARQIEEEASTAEFLESVKLRLEAARLRFEAWVLGRRAAEVLADHDRLVSSLRPECPGSIELPEWLDADVVEVVGPGVALAAIAEGRRLETLPEEHAEVIFRALEAEAHLLRGDSAEALERASWVVEHLGPSEALLRGRAAALAARAALELGDYPKAMSFFGQVLATDPGVIRRLGFELPVVLEPGDDSPEVARALELLEDSPLFDQRPWGFRLVVGGTSAALLLADGTQVFSVSIPSAKSTDSDGVARRIARAVHRELLVPEVDITQADIRSLDGSLGSGGRASERAKSVLDEVMGD